jgi:hypothetical protein
LASDDPILGLYSYNAGVVAVNSKVVGLDPDSDSHTCSLTFDGSGSTPTEAAIVDGVVVVVVVGVVVGEAAVSRCPASTKASSFLGSIL